MLLMKLQRIYDTQHFIDVTTEWQVIDNLVLYRTFVVNQERTT